MIISSYFLPFFARASLPLWLKPTPCPYPITSKIILSPSNFISNFADLRENILLASIPEYDGFVIGSPVHYASASGVISPFLDRLFFAGSRIPSGNPFRLKPATAVVSCRRAGSTATLDQLNKYFLINQMPIISGRYWNMVHGNTPEQVKQDLEGLQNLRIVAKNLAWHLKCKEAGEKAGILPPVVEDTIYTNFIR